MADGLVRWDLVLTCGHSYQLLFGRGPDLSSPFICANPAPQCDGALRMAVAAWRVVSPVDVPAPPRATDLLGQLAGAWRTWKSWEGVNE